MSPLWDQTYRNPKEKKLFCSASPRIQLDLHHARLPAVVNLLHLQSDEKLGHQPSKQESHNTAGGKEEAGMEVFHRVESAVWHEEQEKCHTAEDKPEPAAYERR